MSTNPNLPELCYAIHPSNDRMVTILKNGESGYWEYAELSADRAKAMVDRRNEALGVTPATREAMQAGSLFGWNLPIADPKHHETAA